MKINRDQLKQITGYDYYEGNLIHEPFAYKIFREEVLPIGNIVAFIAPMKVETEGMIDLEDVLAHDYIYSDLAINFVWEIPILCPFGATAFQRYFNTQIANILYKYIKKPIEMNGDDIMVHDQFKGSDNSIQNIGKASVSITYSKNNTALGHTAININAGMSAPKFAYSTNLDNEQSDNFIKEVIDCFYKTVDSIWVSTRKISIN